MSINRDKRKTLKFKIKIVLIIILPVISIALVSMIPRWLAQPWKNTEEANQIIANTFYTVTPRERNVALNDFLNDTSIQEGSTGDMVYHLGVRLLLDKLEENDIILEYNTMLYFVNANQTPTYETLHGVIFYYTDSPHYTGYEIFSFDGSILNFDVAQQSGINVVRI